MLEPIILKSSPIAPEEESGFWCCDDACPVGSHGNRGTKVDDLFGGDHSWKLLAPQDRVLRVLSLLIFIPAGVARAANDRLRWVLAVLLADQWMPAQQKSRSLP